MKRDQNPELDPAVERLARLRADRPSELPDEPVLAGSAMPWGPGDPSQHDAEPARVRIHAECDGLLAVRERQVEDRGSVLADERRRNEQSPDAERRVVDGPGCETAAAASDRDLLTPQIAVDEGAQLQPYIDIGPLPGRHPETDRCLTAIGPDALGLGAGEAGKLDPARHPRAFELPLSHRHRGQAGGQRPLNRAGRFSRKAATPSW